MHERRAAEQGSGGFYLVPAIKRRRPTASRQDDMNDRDANRPGADPSKDFPDQILAQKFPPSGVQQGCGQQLLNCPAPAPPTHRRRRRAGSSRDNPSMLETDTLADQPRVISLVTESLPGRSNQAQGGLFWSV